MLCKIAEHMLVTTRGHQTCDAFQCRAHAGDHEGPPNMWCVPLQSTCWWPRGVTRHAMLAWVPQSNFIVPFKICWSHCDIDSTKVCTLCDFWIWSIRSDNCYADTCQKPRHGFSHQEYLGTQSFLQDACTTPSMSFFYLISRPQLDVSVQVSLHQTQSYLPSCLPDASFLCFSVRH